MSRSAVLCVLGVFGAFAAGCAHSRPTVTGAELYANLASLQTTGAADIGGVHVVENAVLTNGAEGPSYVVKQVVDRCKGGDPTVDVDCTLALLLDQRFHVDDHIPERRTSASAKREDRSSSIVSSVAVLSLAAAATGGLIYGIATCDFPGCKAVFGVPLVLVGGAALFSLGRD